jgi:limonene-1,2-epoxide hydrolase
MTDQLRDLHNYLRACCPASGSTIMREIQLTRKADEKAAALLPKDAVELGIAIKQLTVAGLLEVRADRLVYWLMEPVKAEPQGVLFG